MSENFLQIKNNYFSELLVGAENWAINQIKEESDKKDEEISKLKNLILAQKQYIEFLSNVCKPAFERAYYTGYRWPNQVLHESDTLRKKIEELSNSEEKIII